MKMKKLLVIVAVLAIMLGGFSSPVTVRADWSKVDPRVLDQIDANGTAGFVVVMSTQADVSAAADLRTKVERTTYVYNQLTHIAESTQAPLITYLKAEGLVYESFYIMNMIEVTGSEATLQWLAARPEVARIVPLPDPQAEPVYHETLEGAYGPQLPSQNASTESAEAIEWNITRIGAPEVWATGNHGEGMVVASNDTGVQYTHPALVGKYRGNLGGGNFEHNYNWWDGNSGYQQPHDYDGHGTHTVGTMVGDDGGSNQIGVAPGAKWIACAGLGGTDPIDCFQFFLSPWNLQHQNPDPSKAPDSINNSWYDPSGFDYRPIILNLNAAGIAVIKSAGNNGSACSSISNPGGVPEIIATASFAQGDVISSFSSRGPDSTYGSTILKPEVAAPGSNVRSSYPTNTYTYLSGTSMAAPHTTALVALMWSAASCIQGDVPLTKQIMMETAESKISAQCPPFIDHPNDVWGWGILDAPAAVDAAVAYCNTGVSITPASQTQDGAPGEQVSYDFVVENTSDVAQDIVLTLDSDHLWPTSAPGSTGVLAPGGETVVTVDVTIPANPEYILDSDTFTLTAIGEVDGDDTATGTTNAVVTLDVQVDAPANESGEPLQEVTYVFTVTNTGTYPDSFTLETSGLWPATLPDGNTIGPLDPDESTTVEVDVTVPVDVEDGDTDETTLTATSDLDPTVTGSDAVTTTAIVYSLTIDPSAQEKTGELGMPVHFIYDVTNSTNVAQDVSLSVTGNSWPTEAPSSTGMLEVGATTTITVTVTIPVLPEAVVASDTFTLSAEGDLKGEATASGTTLANANPAVEVLAPDAGAGWPVDVVTYEFTLTNMGNYTDSFALDASGDWQTTLPGGSDTGPLAPGESITVIVLVEVPAGIPGGVFDITTLKATSLLDTAIFTFDDVTTMSLFTSILPIMLK